MESPPSPSSSTSSEELGAGKKRAKGEQEQEREEEQEVVVVDVEQVPPQGEAQVPQGQDQGSRTRAAGEDKNICVSEEGPPVFFSPVIGLIGSFTIHEGGSGKRTLKLRAKGTGYTVKANLHKKASAHEVVQTFLYQVFGSD